MSPTIRSNPVVTGVILWDIDGTLVQVTPSRQDKHRAAAETVLGRSIDPPDSWTGRTDAEILRGLTESAGVAADGAARAAMIEELDRLTYLELESLPVSPAPGVIPAMQAAAERGWVNGLATGNSVSRSRAKLASAGLDSLIDWRHGHFGDSAGDRLELVRASSDSTARLAPGRPIVVVGDTPLDVLAAHGAGLTIVAVATGAYDAATLLKTTPDLLVGNLVTGRDAFVDFLDRQS